MRFEGASRSLVSLPGMQERCVILYTFSKKYAMTGWRLGAAIGPKPIIDVITTLNVNIESCPNHFVQYGAVAALTDDQSGPARDDGDASRGAATWLSASSTRRRASTASRPRPRSTCTPMSRAP